MHTHSMHSSCNLELRCRMESDTHARAGPACRCRRDCCYDDSFYGNANVIAISLIYYLFFILFITDSRSFSCGRWKCMKLNCAEQRSACLTSTSTWNRTFHYYFLIVLSRTRCYQIIESTKRTIVCLFASLFRGRVHVCVFRIRVPWSCTKRVFALTERMNKFIFNVDCASNESEIN